MTLLHRKKAGSVATRRMTITRGALVAGIDEVGRGPWAGPVLAAAVILYPEVLPAPLFDRLADSKTVPRARREAIARDLMAHRGQGIALALAAASIALIDQDNIRVATHRAMARAARRLPLVPDHILVDGDAVPAGLPCAATAVIRGDATCASISAASILAKVLRDRLMTRLAARYPGYGWERNAGYGTAEHAAALARLGPTPHHRLSFAPIRRAIEARVAASPFAR